jgi:hypothetical protein
VEDPEATQLMLEALFHIRGAVDEMDAVLIGEDDDDEEETEENT